ncbi:MAG: beta-ketoacyl-ACP synthase III [Oscillospiraceae bacterium]|nr:beta-ketoacyl-ACP synthase III [Oscillospiraceae bacterium]
MQGIKILGSASYCPETVATNDDFTKIIETNDEWITTRTGVRQRHIAVGETTFTMGVNAARKAVEASGLAKEEIDMIICSTVTPDSFFPSMSCVIQKELDIPGCMAFDISAACSGFVYVLDIAQKYIASGNAKHILVVSAEKLSKLVDYTDRSSCILFGDGAAAVVLGESQTLFSSYMGADGRGCDYLRATCQTGIPCPLFEEELLSDDTGKIFQNGKEVYKFATSVMPKAIAEAAARADIDVNDIDIFIPHQANIRIIKTAASKLGISDEKFYVNIENYGNTSSASIPIALHEAIENKKIKRGDKVLLVGFGAGLTYGAVLIEY